MRILLLDQFAEIGGAQRGLCEAASGFAARGWTLHAAAPSGPLHERLALYCTTTTPIPCGPFRPARKSPFDTARFLAQLGEQAQIVRAIVQHQSIDLLYVNGPRVIPAAALGRLGRPVVYHAHSMVTQSSVASLVKRALRSSRAHVVASSQFAGKWLDPIPVRVIYNGVKRWRNSANPRASYTRIGLLGRIAPEKQQLMFVEAARIASARDSRLQFKIGGGPVLGSPEYFDHVLAASGPEVYFVPWMEDVRGFFDHIDLLVVPSHPSDTNPRVIPEAFAAGVPVLAFDSGGIPELIEHGRTGLLERTHSADALADAISAAVAQPAMLNAIAQNAHAEWHERFTLDRFQSELCRTLESLVPMPMSVSA